MPSRLEVSRYELTHAGDFKSGFFDCIGHVSNVAVAHFFQCGAHHSGTGDPNVDRAVRLAHTMKRSGHEGVILRRIAKDYQFGGANAVLLGCAFSRGADDTPHGGDCVSCRYQLLYCQC